MIRTPTPEAIRAPDAACTTPFERARDTVPYYRDAWTRDGHLAGPSAVITEDSFADVHFLLWPVGTRIGDPWSHAATVDRRTLTGALAAGGQLRRDDAIFEVRDAVVDWTSVGGHDYHVLLSPTARTALSARLRRRLDDHRDALVDGRSGVLVAGSDQVHALLSGTELPLSVRAVERIEWDGIARPPAAGPAVLHATHLGYLGAWSDPCGHWHLARGIHARAGSGGCELSDLLHRGPTLLRYRPRSQPRVRLTDCGSHAALEVDDD